MSFNIKMLTSNTNEWKTPQWLYDKLNAEFKFTLDPAATSDNAKAEKFYTMQNNGLEQNWAGKTVFCNPPYGRQIGEWVRKCYEEWQKNNITIVMLIPARTDTKYFHRYIFNHNNVELRFSEGRLKFLHDGIEHGTAPFPSMIVIYHKI